MPGAAMCYLDGLFVAQTIGSAAGFYIICGTFVFNFVILACCLLKLNDALRHHFDKKARTAGALAACTQKFYTSRAARRYATVTSPTFWFRCAAQCHIFACALACGLYFFCAVGFPGMPAL